MSDKETQVVCKKNYLGASSLMFGIFAISGCWIPLLNVLSISVAIMGFLFGVWSLVKVLRAKTRYLDKIVISLCGIIVSVAAVITAQSVNHTAFYSRGGIKNFMSEVMDAMTGKNIGEKSQQRANSTDKSRDSVSVADQSENKSLGTYKIGESVDLDGRRITLSDVQKNFNMDNEYSAPKEGNRFVRVFVKIENISNSELLVSPQEFKIQDSSGAIESLVSATYLLNDQLESVTLIPGGVREGAVVFEVSENDEDLKLIYQPSSADTKLEFDLQ